MPKIEENSVVAVKKPRRGKKLLISLLVFALTLLAVGGGYYAGTQKNKDNKAPVSAVTNNSTKTTVEPIQKETIAATHFSISQSTPFDLKKTVIVSLGVPAAVQAVELGSTNHNRGYEQYFTNKLNDEVGRWTVGYPTILKGSDNQISILAIGSEWLKETQDVDGPFVAGGDINTPAQKAAYLAKLKSDSQHCSKDKSKGFLTKDTVLQVCYAATKSKYGDDGVITLRGYGDFQGQSIILLGVIDTPDVQQSTVSSWADSLAQTSIVLK